MLGYTLLAGARELDSDVVTLSWFLLLRFLCLPLAIFLSLMLVDLVSEWSVSKLCVCGLWAVGPVLQREIGSGCLAIYGAGCEFRWQWAGPSSG